MNLFKAALKPEIRAVVAQPDPDPDQKDIPGSYYSPKRRQGNINSSLKLMMAF
jgi:hypothetical protein